MGRQARLKRQRKEERDRPLKEMAERIYMSSMSGDRVLDENGEPIEFTSVEEVEKYLKESAKGNDVDKLERKMNEAFNEFL